MSKQDQIHDALNLLEEDLLEYIEVLRRTPHKKASKVWLRWGAIAACLCLLAGAAVAPGLNWGGSASEGLSAGGVDTVTEGAFGGEAEMEGAAQDEMNEEAADNCFEASEGSESGREAINNPISGGVMIEPLNVDLCDHPDMQIDMEAFFIYQGRCYVYYGTLEDASPLVGEHMGTATGLIDEWTEEDGYVDYAGSITGDFYSVNGFDTEFALCMQRDDAAVEIYLNNNDLTLYTGADLLKDRFKIDDQFTAECMSSERWYNSSGVPCEMNEEATGQVWALVEAMFDSPFVYVEDIQLPEEADDNLYATELFHLYLYEANGMMVHLRLFEGGYIQLDGLRSVCIKVAEDVFDQTVKYLYAAEEGICGG